MSFYEQIESIAWSQVKQEIMSCSATDVAKALDSSDSSTLRLEGLKSLLSPAAAPFLEEMAQAANRLTQQRFGRVMGLFAPLYLSNECSNLCAYCGFNVRNPMPRLTLSIEEALNEGRFLYDQNFRHLLLVSGEAPHVISVPYLVEAAQELRKMFASISIEIYPMGQDSYEDLIHAGVDGLVSYQETYDLQRYEQVHLGGRKKDYKWRIETPERGGRAGFRRLGIGALLGLSDWRTEGFFLALHAQYLLRHFWQSHVTVSFPRMRRAAGGDFLPPCPISDANLVQLITALRLFLPDVGLVLSTRELPLLRDNLIPLGITAVSAGSRTDPGGYVLSGHAGAQFEIADNRSASQMADVLRQKGYQPVWKDWDVAFLHGIKGFSQ